MAIYLFADCIKDAVDRLAHSTAASSLGEYLIFKRALVLRTSLDSEDTVVTGMGSPTFVQAIREVSSVDDPSDKAPERERPFFNPFGAARKQGYRMGKYVSNGPSDTVSRWQNSSRATPPFAAVPGTSPKEYRFVSRTPEELAAFFMTDKAKESLSTGKPRLLDVAVWWFRFTDLEQRFGTEPTAIELTEGVISDLALNSDEISGLFAHTNLA